jgi:hypothetical protein
MLGRTLKFSSSALLLMALCGILGCGGGGDDGNLRPPVTNLTGTWEGEAKDPGVTGNYWYPIEFTFRQSGNTVTGISSFPGLARFTGKLDGSTLTIEGTDIFAYLSRDGNEIRGSFTSSGMPGGGDATTGGTTTVVGGQTATFYLQRVGA